MEIDAKDNGVSEASDMRFQIGTDLSNRIARLNPAWNDALQTHPEEQFKKAMKVAEEELYWKLH